MKTKACLLALIEKLRNEIESEDFRNSARKSSNDFTRERKMNFRNLIYFMLNLVKESSQTALDRFMDEQDRKERISQQAFSKARQKIGFEPFQKLFFTTAQTPYESYCATWNGYRVSAIDGSHIALPNYGNLREYFGGLGPTCSSPTAHGSILYDVLNKIIMDADLAPLSTNEREQAKKHILSFDNLGKKEKELILFDRGYPSHDLISVLRAQGIRFLMRVPRKFNKHVDNQKQSDGLVEFMHEGKPFNVRVIKFDLPSGECETLITDLFDESLTIEHFKSLYFMRWNIETKYNELKSKLEIENFSGRSVEAVKQDFYISMFMSNIASVAAREADKEIAANRQGKDNKYEYKTNINHEIGVLKDRFILAVMEPSKWKRAREINKIMKRIAQAVIPIRPDRSNPRISPPRRTKFHLNAKSNC